MAVNYTMLLNEIEKGLGILSPSPLQDFCFPQRANHLNDVATSSHIHLMIKRDDLLHPIISGNKWRKLKYCLVNIIENKHHHIISFGGGHSNHLHALAYICYRLDIKLTAIVRGDYQDNLTPTLKDISKWGSNIHFVNKIDYKKRDNLYYCEALKQQFNASIVIPEGGSQQSALQGVSEIWTELAVQTHTIDRLFLPVASGGTLAGLVAMKPAKVNVTGIAVLKGEDYLESLVGNLLPRKEIVSNWHIEHGFHQGGYAKKSTELMQFCHQFSCTTNIPLEPVYSGKLLFAVNSLRERKLAEQKFIVNNTSQTWLVLHTGGLRS